ncbi:hypothetical protein B0H12DRAFT_1112644 [Mycena haematopus]|nr:hypothetical protein B0H12DRAFT_1112644 [Mycena haematopus]
MRSATVSCAPLATSCARSASPHAQLRGCTAGVGGICVVRSAAVLYATASAVLCVRRCEGRGTAGDPLTAYRSQ